MEKATKNPSNEDTLRSPRKRKQSAVETYPKKEKSIKLSNKPVRRKLTFDSLEKEECCRHNSSDKNIEMVKKQTFSIELENLLNVSLEENRKRCIEKYNFDPVLEKPLDGKFVWEKVAD